MRCVRLGVDSKEASQAESLRQCDVSEPALEQARRSIVFSRSEDDAGNDLVPARFATVRRLTQRPHYGMTAIASFEKALC